MAVLLRSCKIHKCCEQAASVLLRSINLSSPRNLIEVKSEADFKEKVLGSKKPVVVDFHAEWCGPCKTLAPVLEGAVQNRGGRVELAKVDIDELQDLAMNYKVTVVPTVLGMKAGESTAHFTGVQSKQFIEKFLDRLEQN
ncbi:hypothetical protein EMCRGX_G029818 [Ephydatia muelleri]|eukprot:Em0648g8a